MADNERFEVPCGLAVAVIFVGLLGGVAMLSAPRHPAAQMEQAEWEMFRLDEDAEMRADGEVVVDGWHSMPRDRQQGLIRAAAKLYEIQTLRPQGRRLDNTAVTLRIVNREGAVLAEVMVGNRNGR